MLWNCVFDLFSMNHNFVTYGTSRKWGDNILKFSIDNYNYIKELETILEKWGFDFVVNCIWYINRKTWESDYEEIYSKYILINAHLPKTLDFFSKKYWYKLIHISTNGIFSPDTHSKTILDVPDNISYYWLSKLLWEIDNSKNLTIRISIIWVETWRKNNSILNWFLLLKDWEEISWYSNVLWNWITTLTLAKIIEKIILYDLKISWILHITWEHINKYQLLTLFNKVFHKNIKIVNDISISNNNTIITNLNNKKIEGIIKPIYKQIQELKDFYNL